MGIFFAIGLPIDIPDKSVSLSFYFEANYKLPNNKTANNFYDYLQDKNFNRKFAYDVIQNKLENAGYPGKKCLLRAICEASIAPLINNGIIGDILHIIFTPSSSYNENLPDDIVNAERKTECANQYCECPISLLDLISHFEDY
ncbi:hypothetical protein HCN44_009309 [Aphidius gifuensis]|uniref:Uncharacterized protein n=2 Tax=Aphidius gifuensis TaxID=684658 RepID=A0A834Y4G7_APHGI|nr:hypothetical protein HCN44_009309 [Aphidius gifuensis]